MRKEITARAYTDHARNQPAGEKHEPFSLSGDKQRDQAHRGKNPNQRFCLREPDNGFQAKLTPVGPGHRADVFQVVCKHVVDQLAQSMTRPEVESNNSDDSEQSTQRPNGEYDCRAPSFFRWRENGIEDDQQKPIHRGDLLECDRNSSKRAADDHE